MSAVDVQIGTDWYYSLSDWSVEGTATPLIAGDMTGGAGSMSFTLPEDANSRRLQGRSCLLRDPDMGETTGNLRLAGGNYVNSTITGYSKIAMLNVNRTVDLYSGTLRGAILYYLGLCGVTTNIAVENSLATRTVRYIGWEGNVLDHIKDLCSAQGMELSLIGSWFAFRVAGKRQITTASFAEYTWDASEDQLAQNVEVAWYNTSAPTSQLVYPVGGWTPDVPVFQVGIGETSTYEIDLHPSSDEDNTLGISVSSIVQPTCVADVPRNYAGTDSVYSVAGKDGLIIQPAQWAAGGGDLSLELLEGGSKIKVTITGSQEAEYGPFQIAMSSGPSDSYSSLRIYGSGMRYRRSSLTMATGLDGDRASTETTPAVDTPFLNSYEAAWKAATGMLSRHSSATYSIKGTIGQVQTDKADPTTYFGGTTLPDDPAVHPFGNLEGSLFLADGITFRIRKVTSGPDGATFTAEQHTTGASNTAAMTLATGNATMTAAQWNAYYPAGLTADDYNAAPWKGYTL